MINRLQILLCLLLVGSAIAAQSLPSQNGDTSGIRNSRLVSSYVKGINSKADRLNQKLDKYSAKALAKAKKQEDLIIRKLTRKDSLKAIAVFGNAEEQYKQLEQRLQKVVSLQQYVPSLDSLSLSIKFLQENFQLLSRANKTQQKLKDAMGKVTSLEQRFQKAEEIKIFLRERKKILKDQLQSLGFAKQLKKLSKGSYYYQAKISEYREILKNHKRAEKKVMELLTKTKIFRDFITKNSFLARLFPIPVDNPSSFGGAGGGIAGSGFAGLQTRMQVSSFIQQAGFSGPNAVSQMQQNISDAQAQLTDLRNKIAQLGGAGGDDLDMPDFIIKSLKTKPFFKRLEYAANFQTQKANRFFPNTSDAGLSVGYRTGEKSVVGIGINYKLGLGNGWNNMKLTHEGIQFVSYVDWKIFFSKKAGREGTGNFWLSGGYEQNFKARFKRVDELKNLNAWQQSLLLGVSKTVPLKTKFFKNTKFRLLWDCLAFKQVPKTKALLFRVSYNF
jgi:hypothetical protein